MNPNVLLSIDGVSTDIKSQIPAYLNLLFYRWILDDITGLPSLSCPTPAVWQGLTNLLPLVFHSASSSTSSVSLRTASENISSFCTTVDALTWKFITYSLSFKRSVAI